MPAKRRKIEEEIRILGFSSLGKIRTFGQIGQNIYRWSELNKKSDFKFLHWSWVGDVEEFVCFELRNGELWNYTSITFIILGKGNFIYYEASELQQGDTGMIGMKPLKPSGMKYCLNFYLSMTVHGGGGHAEGEMGELSVYLKQVRINLY